VYGILIWPKSVATLTHCDRPFQVHITTLRGGRAKIVLKGRPSFSGSGPGHIGYGASRYVGTNLTTSGRTVVERLQNPGLQIDVTNSFTLFAHLRLHFQLQRLVAGLFAKD